jgi:polysaccharide export outer membrane protein
VYFQGGNFSKTSPTTIPNKRFIYRIQPNDVLSIRVKSLDPLASNPYNKEAEGVFNQFSPASFYVNGYSVNEEGNITLPYVGLLKVANLTLDEVQEAVQKVIDRAVKNSTVYVSLVSFKVSVLGEVKNPGHYFAYNNQMTILEALGMAGDLTGLGNPKNITLVRQVEKGSEVIAIDLTDPKLMASKYYYLLPNDVVYIQPLEAKNKRANSNNMLIFFSGISAIAGVTAIILNALGN